MVDIKSELEKKYTTLSDRLNQLDQFNQNTAAPQISGERPKGYNPMNSMQALFQMMSNRNALATDQGNVLKQLSDYEQANQPEAVDPIKLRQQMLDEITAGKKWNPETQTFDSLSGDELFSSVDLKGTSKTDMELLRAIDAATTAAESQYNEGYSGLLDSLLGTGRIKTNAKGSDKEAQFRQTIAEVQNTIRSYISGAAINESEQKFLEKLYPKITDSDVEIQRKIQGVRDWAKRKAQGILDTGGYGVDAGDYLKSTGARQETGIGQGLQNSTVGDFTIKEIK